MRVIVKLALMNGKPPYFNLADVIQTLKCSDDCSIVSVRKEV